MASNSDEDLVIFYHGPDVYQVTRELFKARSLETPSSNQIDVSSYSHKSALSLISYLKSGRIDYNELSYRDFGYLLHLAAKLQIEAILVDLLAAAVEARARLDETEQIMLLNCIWTAGLWPRVSNNWPISLSPRCLLYFADSGLLLEGLKSTTAEDFSRMDGDELMRMFLDWLAIRRPSSTDFHRIVTNFEDKSDIFLPILIDYVDKDNRLPKEYLNYLLTRISIKQSVNIKVKEKSRNIPTTESNAGILRSLPEELYTREYSRMSERYTVPREQSENENGHRPLERENLPEPPMTRPAPQFEIPALENNSQHSLQPERPRSRDRVRNATKRMFDGIKRRFNRN